MGQEKRVNQKTEQIRPVTVKIEDFKHDLQEAVTKSELPTFMLEMILGEYLSGVSIVARREYAQDRADWEKTVKAGEKDG